MLRFEHGEWNEIILSNERENLLEETCKRMGSREAVCGAWILEISRLGSEFSVYEYRVIVEILWDEYDTPLLIEDILVLDFPSLLQLFTILRSATIEAMPPKQP